MAIRKDDLSKIVCTIGPACEKKETLVAMLRAGMDVARLNFSHSSHDWHFQAILNLRHAAYQTRKCLGIMADIQGPRIRIAEIENKKSQLTELKLIQGDRIFLKEKKEKGKLPGYLEKHLLIDLEVDLLDKLKVGEKVYLDNGMIELQAEHFRRNLGWEMTVKNDGLIKVRKGINFPTLANFIPSFTQKDTRDLHFALKQGLDFVALSFVKNAQDITNLRSRMQKFLGKKKGLPLIVAKIETLTALENIKEILAVTDAVMVARGDMGIEAPQEKVPIYQKLLIRHCLKKRIPVIVATNMLESMVDFPRPTRAELTDVANAVIDRADAVMLSGETASGKYPVRSVQTMSKIIRATEKSFLENQNYIPELEKNRNKPTSNQEEIIAQTIQKLAEEKNLKAIVLKNTPISLIANLAGLRPSIPVFCYVGNHNPWSRKLLIYFAVLPYFSEIKFKLAVAKLKNYVLVKGDYDGKKWQYDVTIM